MLGTKDVVFKLVTKSCGLKDITTEMSFDKLDLFEQVELIVNLEWHFDIHINDDKFRACKTINDIITMIDNELTENTYIQEVR